MDPNLKF